MILYANGFRQIYHFHIAKCGGTHLNAWMQRHAADTKWSGHDVPWAESKHFATKVSELAGETFDVVPSPASAFFQWDVICTHRNLLNFLRPNTFSLTVLRDPRARLISKVSDWRREAYRSHAGDPIVLAALKDSLNYTLGEFLERHAFGPLRFHFDNHLVRTFSDLDPNHSFIGDITPDLVTNSIHILESRFNLVGITERMADTRRAICYELGLVPDLEGGGKKNEIGAKNIDAAEIVEATDILNRITKFDYHLYDRAVEIFNQRHVEKSVYSERYFELMHAKAAVDRASPTPVDKGILYSVRDVILAGGIHQRDGDGSDACAVWTGPETRSVLYLSVPVDEKIIIQFFVRGYSSAEIRSSLKFLVDDTPVAHEFKEYRGFADLIEIRFHTTREFIKFTVDTGQVVSHVEDQRLRGLAFSLYGWRLSHDYSEYNSDDVEKNVHVVSGNTNYMRQLSNRIAELPALDKESINIHLSYLAIKANMTVESLLLGEPFTVDKQIEIDAHANIDSILARDKSDNVIFMNSTIIGDSGYFAKLFNRLCDIDPLTLKEVIKHVEYLADKVGLKVDEIFSGVQFEVNEQVQLDAIKNIEATVCLRHSSSDFEVKNSLGLAAEIIVDSQSSLPGWCSNEKANLIAELVRQNQPLISVEIGVFGGRSLIPVAAVLKELGRGIVYGIETWSPIIATENPTNELNDQWWQAVDFNFVKSSFLNFIGKHDLVSYIKLVEVPSSNAAILFSSIDFLHIDGSHSVVNSSEDVLLYAMKVKKGGIIIMDDVNWKSTSAAVIILNEIGIMIADIKDESGNIICAIYQRN